MHADRELIGRIRTVLAAAADPERAASQQRYLKSAMPMYGLGRGRTTTALRPLLRSYAPADREIWEGTVRELWDDATHREERYAAVTLARHRAARPWRDAAALPLCRHLVVTGAWWDLVDEIACHLVGDILAADRPGVTPVMQDWARADDLWLRRTAVLCQLLDKTDTDTELLRFTVEANLDDGSFWLRKAIGWALRDYAKTDPAWVRAELDRLGGRLSPLSRREAAKHLAGSADRPGGP